MYQKVKDVTCSGNVLLEEILETINETEECGRSVTQEPIGNSQLKPLVHERERIRTVDTTAVNSMKYVYYYRI